MADDFRIQIVLRTTDNIPANFITNSFALHAPGGADTAATEAAFIAFYNSIKSLYSFAVAGSGHQLVWSDLPGVKPNYPFRTISWSFTGPAPSGDTLPAEVAEVLSFQGSRAAGFPQARRRGRVFIGPLQQNVAANGRPTPTSRTTLANAASALKTALAAPGGQHWAVWSVADQAPVEIQDGWVDDTFDTQRRRGLSTTNRTIWS